MVEKEPIIATEQKELTVSDSKIKYVTQGHGDFMMVCMGPGTILMKFFSNAFKSKVTLVAIDQNWTHDKDSKDEKCWWRRVAF